MKVQVRITVDLDEEEAQILIDKGMAVPLEPKTIGKPPGPEVMKVVTDIKTK